MQINIQKKYILFIILGVILCILQNPNTIYSGAFALVFMAVIYLFFSTDFKILQLCTLLLFVIINSNLYFFIGRSQLYFFYVPIFIYYVNLIIELIRSRKNIFDAISKSQILILYVFIIYMIFSIFISANKYIAVSSIKGHIIMLSVLVIFLIECKSLNTLKSLSNAYLVLLSGVLFTGFLQILSINLGTVNHFATSGLSVEMYPHIVRIPMTFFFNPNNYSLYLVVSMIIITGNIIYKKNRNLLIINTILYALCLINLIFAMSRTCWITLIFTLSFGMVFYLFNYKKSKDKLYRILAITLCSIVIYNGLSFIPFMQPYYGKINQVKSMITKNTLGEGEASVELGNSGSINIRATLIADVLKGVFVEKHFLGFGPGNTSNYIRKLNNTHKIYSVHSFWLEILGDYGVIIFLFVLALYVYACIRILLAYIKVKNTETESYTFIIGLIMFSLIFLTFAPSTVLNQPIFWIYLGSCFEFVYIINQKLLFN